MNPGEICMGPESGWGAKGGHLGGSGRSLKDSGKPVNSSDKSLGLKEGLLRP